MLLFTVGSYVTAQVDIGGTKLSIAHVQCMASPGVRSLRLQVMLAIAHIKAAGELNIVLIPYYDILQKT